MPINLPANHSISDLFNQAWPGPDDHHLSVAAARAAKVVALALLGGLVFVSARARDPLAQTNALGAFTV